jgi:hypothetical protein
MTNFIETLEDRSLLSASFLPAVSTTILADRAAVVAAKNQISSDLATWNLTVAQTRNNIPSVRKAGLAQLRADRAQIFADRGDPLKETVDRGMLKSDTATVHANNFAAVHAVPTVIGKKISAIAIDRGKYHAALQQLHIDQILHR